MPKPNKQSGFDISEQAAANDGDVYVNEGSSYDNGIYTPEVNQETKDQIAEQVAPVASSLPIMDDVADWFRTKIDECDDIHNVQVTELTVNGVVFKRTVSVEAQVLAYQLLKEKLQEKLTEFDEFGKDRDE